jgi:hypothetical protein
VSLVTSVKCDMCGSIWPVVELPDGWYGLARNGDHLHFCSPICLSQWMLNNVDVGPLVKVKVLSQEQPDCKARRFLLVDGETADIYEGVRFASGHVAVDGLPFTESPYWFESWDSLKEKCPGSGVQWIDQEVQE